MNLEICDFEIVIFCFSARNFNSNILQRVVKILQYKINKYSSNFAFTILLNYRHKYFNKTEIKIVIKMIVIFNLIIHAEGYQLTF